jgi:hypothetical protein
MNKKYNFTSSLLYEYNYHVSAFFKLNMMSDRGYHFHFTPRFSQSSENYEKCLVLFGHP